MGRNREDERGREDTTRDKGTQLRRHHYAACQSIRLDRSRNGPNGNSNIPCATEAPSAIRAPTVGAIPGRNRGGKRVSVSGSNAEPRGRCAGATAARAGFRRRRRLTTLNEQGELPVLDWIAVSGLILVHRGPRPQGGPGAAPAPGLHCPCFPSMQTTTRPLARFIPSA